MDKQKQIDKDISVRSKMIEEMSKIMFEKEKHNEQGAMESSIRFLRRKFF